MPAISHVALAVPNGLVLLLLAATARLGAETPQRPLPPSARAARNEQRTLDLSDLGRQVFLEHARISPSGDAVAVVASRANLEEDRYDATLLLVDLASGEQRELARGFRGVRTPEWSPSGDRLAFLAADDGGTSQLWVLPMTGGEPRRLTDGEEGVGYDRWSPDGRSVVFGRTEAAPKREGVERHNRSFEVGNDSYLTREPPRPVLLWRIPAGGGEPERLTNGPESVVDFGWTRDGRALVMDVQPGAHGSDFLRTSLERLDLRSRRRRLLVPPTPEPQLEEIVTSPDGRYVAFHRPRGAHSDFDPTGIFVVPTGGGAARDATADIDRDLLAFAWLPDGSGMLVAGPDRTSIGVWLQPLDGPARRLELGSVDPISELSVSDGGRVVFIGTEPHRPPELYVMEGPAWMPRRITDFNHEIAGREMGRVEAVTWAGPDGFQLDGVLIYPAGFQNGRRYPLLVNIHGGPTAATQGFVDSWRAGPFPFSGVPQLFAAQGWLVFTPNYRGTNSRGAAFQRGIIDDPGAGPARDIMSGIELLKARGIVDEARIAVGGWSYGGLLTVWLTAHHDIWAAAVAGAAATDFLDEYAASDLNVWWRFGLGGSPWQADNLANYRRQSPITYAHRIRTPTLILADVGDERVPITQSYELYHALKDNGVEVKFIAYPVPGHFPPDPVHRLDVFRRWIAWVAGHVAVRRDATPPSSKRRR